MKTQWQVKVCVFVTETMRHLRLATVAADIPRLTWLIEATYYEAYSIGNSRIGRQEILQLDQFDVA